MSFSRSDRSRLAEWWFTVDRRLLAMLLALIGAGILLSLAASPAVALKRGFEPYHFVSRHVVFAALGTAVLLVVSFLQPSAIRQLATAMLVGAIGGLIAVLWVGPEINGARRWLPVLGQTIQPSEFVKPAYVVIVAWLLAEARRRPDMPGLWLAFGLTATIAGLMMAEPDVGQTMLIVAVFGLLYLVSGQPIIGAAAIAGFGAAGLAFAYANYTHVSSRIDRYLAGNPGERSQVDRALQAFAEGGMLGRGPGEGTVKIVLPDAHTDFIFAVVAEEYGAIACLGLLALYAAIAMLAVVRAAREADHANRLAVIGLAAMFSAQAAINMSVNTGLLPAKGMTLPFISAGGSSMMAVSITVGMLLALTRRRHDVANAKKPRLVPTT
ncbi:MAG: putative peptidoglycan glycosyltransferase FtsW [Hyphomicrobium aestuarii]|nr:putative peptidoglycan glycosyltransferase FtsW [Hyphomicrobium aestuarii]